MLNLIPDVDIIPLDRAFGLLREIKALCLATSQPTPDAVQESRRNQLDILHRYRTGAYALSETALDDILALSTPVSSPEGVGETLTMPFNPCLAKLRDGEPFFVLLGRDKQAPNAVMTWANDRQAAEGKSAWTEQAREVACGL